MGDRTTGKNWFERNPKKIVFFLLLITIGGMAFLTEKILAIKARPNVFHPGIKRYIILRETRPLYSDIIVPSQITMDLSDNLIQKGYRFHIDENGFIMPSKIHPNPQVSLAFFGGSTTECCYLEEQNRFPYLAGRLVEKKTGLRINSYNAGKGGNTSLHSLDVLLNKVIPVKVDLAIWLHNVNDLSVLLYEKTFWTKNPYRSPWVVIPPTFKSAMKKMEEGFHILRDITIPLLTRQIETLAHRLFGRRLGTDEFKKTRGRKVKIDQAFLVSEFTMNLQTFVNLCRARHITPVLMTMESRFSSEPDDFIRKSVQDTVGAGLGLSYAEFKELFDLFNQTIRDVGAANGILVIDLARKVPQKKELMYDSVHFNDTGSQLASEIIAQELAPAVTSLHQRRTVTSH